MIFYAGDTHGRLEDVKQIEKEAVAAGASLIIQVGDFGVHFKKECSVAKWFETRDGGLNWITCGGNHDNWPKWRAMPEVEIFNGKVRQIAPGCFFAERGTVLDIMGESHLFFGGAESIDKVFRKEGSSWWEEETPTQEEALTFYDAMLEYQPEVLVTHDAPIRIDIKKLNRDTNPTPRMLENVLKHCGHKPSRWYFGHHHVKSEWAVEGTTFYCCGFHGEYFTIGQPPV